MYSGHVVEKAPSSEFFRNPLHPYSKALLNSLPTRNTVLKLKTIEGAPPGLQEKIDGCKFNPRCEFCKSEICKNNQPKLEKKCENHFSACLIL